MSRPLSLITNSLNATSSSQSFSPSALFAPDHLYEQPRPSDGRSPCPALNTLANHGYIPRQGNDIGFLELIKTLRHVYNISWFLALTLTIVGFITSGQFTFFRNQTKIPSQPDTWSFRARRLLPIPQWRLDLASLSLRGPEKIAHNAALVHPNNVVSHAPDKTLVQKLLTFSSPRGTCRMRGLSLFDLASYHKKRTEELSSPLNSFHCQIALGECGLAWAVMRRQPSSINGMERRNTGESANSERDEVIPEETIQKWFGCEQLPSDWWVDGGSRPVTSIGLFEAKRRAGDVARIIAN